MRLAGCVLPLAILAAPWAAACTCEQTVGRPTADRSDGVIPEVRAPRVADEAIVIDGLLDEEAWEVAGATGAFVRPGDGAPERTSRTNATAWLAWSDQRLFVAMVVYDDEATTPFRREEVDPHVWERASGVELMLQPGDRGDNRDYYEVQVDVGGAVWDTRFDDYNQPVGGGTFGHQSWSSALARAVRVDDDRYTVEMALPWEALEGARVPVPPAPGARWRANLYAFRDGQRDAMAWSPLLGEGNFHRASRFGRVTFSGP